MVSLFLLSVPAVNFDPASNMPRRGAGEEYPFDAKLLQPREIVLRNYAAGDDDDIRSLSPAVRPAQARFSDQNPYLFAGE